jgi:Flp pilus assembly protein TadG
MRKQVIALDVGRQRGTSLVELAVLVTFLLLVTLGVIDFGRGFYVAIEVSNAANAGAAFGLQNPNDHNLDDIVRAAKNDAADTTISATAVTGCMCSDGSSQTPGLATCNAQSVSCAPGHQVVAYVAVSTAATYTPMFPWPGVPGSIPLTGSATYWIGQ